MSDLAFVVFVVFTVIATSIGTAAVIQIVRWDRVDKDREWLLDCVARQDEKILELLALKEQR